MIRPAEDGTLKALVQGFERLVIGETLAACAGNRSAAARALGITYRGLLKKLHRLGP